MTVDRTWRDWAGRRGPLLAEIAVLIALSIADTVVALHPHDISPTGELAVSVTGGLGTFAAVLAVLRRRLPQRVATLTLGVAAASFLGSGLSALAGALGRHPPANWAGAETVGLALLVGSSARRLASGKAIAVSVLGGLAMVLAPLARNGTDNLLVLLAVPAALLWGGALAVGLLLRDGDQRRAAELAADRRRVRRHERLRMARELHDLVAHHITGVVVLAQAARVVAVQPGQASGQDVFTQIEQAGAEALAATRQLVTVLRTGEDVRPEEPSGVLDVVRRMIQDEDEVSLTATDGVEEAPLTREGIDAVRWTIVEALTNVRRHAPHAHDVQVSLRTARDDDQDWLELSVLNDGVPASSPAGRTGYGLVGMEERLTALGGSLTAGPQPDRCWRVSARIPFDRERSRVDG